jgi:thiosulfate dehydrogenase (quinone) large subunit
MRAYAKAAWRFGRQEILKDGAYLLPLRFFIGLGWLRTFAEKLINPDWYNGTALSTFFSAHLADGSVVFPIYRDLVTNTFLPNVVLLSWMILLGELFCGLAILFGCFSNVGLIGGIFMNLNFILSGVPDPSAFYVVIQGALLVNGTGAICGVDTLLSRRIKLPLLVAQVDVSRSSLHFRRYMLLGLMALFPFLGLYALLHVQTMDPGRSVKDPAMILLVLSIVGGMHALISYLRLAALFEQLQLRRSLRLPDPISSRKPSVDQADLA